MRWKNKGKKAGYERDIKNWTGYESEQHAKSQKISVDQLIATKYDVNLVKSLMAVKRPPL